MGIKTLADTERLDQGKLKTVYLDFSIGGFAIHLIRA